MDSGTHKTEQEQLAFTDKFAEIVKDNTVLKGRYKIRFMDIGDYTHFFISDNNDRFLDVIKIMSKHEYNAYIDLINHWSK
jgi:5-hydroxyisourate hydrolase-like protein (transthyretin family)